MIGKFRGYYQFLSNFYAAPTTYDGITYPCSECAFQAAKTLDPVQREKFVHMGPIQAKHAGKRVSLRSDWEDVKYSIMMEIVHNKFTQNPALMEMLVQTYPHELVEGNTWGDRYWGKVNGYGFNALGQILMTIRDYEMKRREKEGI